MSDDLSNEAKAMASMFGEWGPEIQHDGKGRPRGLVGSDLVLATTDRGDLLNRGAVSVEGVHISWWLEQPVGLAPWIVSYRLHAYHPIYRQPSHTFPTSEIPREIVPWVPCARTVEACIEALCISAHDLMSFAWAEKRLRALLKPADPEAEIMARLKAAHGLEGTERRDDLIREAMAAGREMERGKA